MLSGLPLCKTSPLTNFEHDLPKNGIPVPQISAQAEVTLSSPPFNDPEVSAELVHVDFTCVLTDDLASVCNAEGCEVYDEHAMQYFCLSHSLNFTTTETNAFSFNELSLLGELFIRQSLKP